MGVRICVAHVPPGTPLGPAGGLGRRAGIAEVGHVQAGAHEPLEAAVGGQPRHAVAQEPAILAVGAEDAVFQPERPAPGERAGADLAGPRPRGLLRVDPLRPSVAQLLLGRPAREVQPVLVQPGASGLDVGHPDHDRGGCLGGGRVNLTPRSPAGPLRRCRSVTCRSRDHENPADRTPSSAARGFEDHVEDAELLGQRQADPGEARLPAGEDLRLDLVELPRLLGRQQLAIGLADDLLGRPFPRADCGSRYSAGVAILMQRRGAGQQRDSRATGGTVARSAPTHPRRDGGFGDVLDVPLVVEEAAVRIVDRAGILRDPDLPAVAPEDPRLELRRPIAASLATVRANSSRRPGST